MISPALRVGPDETTTILRIGRDIIARTGLCPNPDEKVLDFPDGSTTADASANVQTLAGATNPASASETEVERGAGQSSSRKAVGRPRTRPPYPVAAILITFFELLYSGRPISLTQVANALWYRYTPEQMAVIGMAEFRDAERARQMRDAARRAVAIDATAQAATAQTDGSETPVRSAAPVSSSTATATATATAIRLWRNEYERLRLAFDKACDPADDTFAPANKRLTNADLDAARAAADPVTLARRTSNRTALMNRIVAASLAHANEVRHPGTTVLDGLLSDWKGDIAVDVHNKPETLADGGIGVADNQLAPASQLARAHAKVRRLRHGTAIGLTFGIAVSRPDNERVPPVAVAMATHEPIGASVTGVVDVLDSLQTMGLRRPLRSNSRQYVVADMGYTPRVGFNAALAERGYGAVFEYPAKHRTFFDLTPKAHEDAGYARGPFLFNGVAHCPGMGGDVDSTRRFDNPGDDATDAHLARHRIREQTLAATVMKLKARPERFTHTKPGRPARDAPAAAPDQDTDEGGWRLRLVCPAAAGSAQCSLFGAVDPASDVPVVPNPPEGDARPPICRGDRTYTTANLDHDTFKKWQPLMSGTWEHHDLYTAARSHNEHFHSRYTDNSAGNITFRDSQFRKNAQKSIILALGAAVTNLKIIDSWDETLRTNNGRAPLGDGRRKAHNRETRIADHHATRRRR